MVPTHTILFATDLSERAHQAFPFACALARDAGARLLILHVMPPVLTYGEAVARRQSNGFRDDLTRQLHDLRAPDDDVRVEYHLLEGDPVSTIVRFAEAEQVGLIVLTTHGRTGLARVLLGSVAEGVLRRAKCPVLTLRGAVPAVEKRTEYEEEPVAAAGVG